MNSLPLGLHRYKITTINPDLRTALQSEGAKCDWTILAGTLSSAWGKFITQHFDALKPNPSDYDIRLDHQQICAIGSN